LVLPCGSLASLSSRESMAAATGPVNSVVSTLTEYGCLVDDAVLPEGDG
jgi:hypothetical protein